MKITNSKKRIATKLAALMLVLVLLTSAFVSCGAAKGKKVVGTVGEYEVLYEELYFLATSYRESLAAKYGAYETLDEATAKAFEDELCELVYSNITTNYAILSICAEAGLTLEDKELDARVDEYIDTLVIATFGGSKSDYKAALSDYGLTDHYVRFTAAVDLLYSDLSTKMLTESEIENDDAKMKEIIKNEFARTWHIMIFNDKGDSVEDNRAKAEEALAKYKDGSMTMYKLIGSSYNEDLSITELDGIYFAKGSMNEVYEKAAFDLEVGEISDVIEMVSANSSGEMVSTFCILQRLEIEDEYVTNNLDSLKQKYIDSLMYGMVEEKQETLVFTPNDFASGLQLATLK